MNHPPTPSSGIHPSNSHSIVKRKRAMSAREAVLLIGIVCAIALTLHISDSHQSADPVPEPAEKPARTGSQG
jgi:hypothetical protein